MSLATAVSVAVDPAVMPEGINVSRPVITPDGRVSVSVLNPKFEFTDEVNKDDNAGSHMWPATTKATARYNMGAQDLSSYKYINFWVKTDNPGGQVFKMVLLRGTSQSSGYYAKDGITLTDDKFAQITMIYFSAASALSYPVYFDEMYLSKNKEAVELADYTLADFGAGDASDIFEPGGNSERTEISDEVVLDGSETSMKWKSGFTNTCASGSNRFTGFMLRMTASELS